MKNQPPEVLHNSESLLLLDAEDIEALRRTSRTTERKVARLCSHSSEEEPLHEMFVVHPREFYVRPHYHRGKEESLHVIEGEAIAVFFDDRGQVTKAVELGRYGSQKHFYYRIAAGLAHMLLIQSDIFIFHEVTRGPFRREDTIFPYWSPAVGEESKQQELLSRLHQEIRRHLSIT